MTTEEEEDAREAEVKALLLMISQLCEEVSMNVVMTAMLEMVSYGIRSRGGIGTQEHRLSQAIKLLTKMVRSDFHRLEERNDGEPLSKSKRMN